MIYSVRHLTSFRYSPAVGETIMEVRLQPRSDTQQRCLAFSLDVAPRTNVMIYRDFVFTGRKDLAFLQDTWPSIKESMSYLEQFARTALQRPPDAQHLAFVGESQSVS